METVEDDSNVQRLEISPSSWDKHLCYDSLLNQECNWGSNLTSLCLSGSYTLNLRHLGLTLPNLRELSVNCCKLKSLDGLSNFPHLQILNASCNNINDLYPCVYLENINYIDLKRNEICDMSNIEYLALCPKLESLILLENPLCFDVKNKDMKVPTTYCAQIANLIPHLKYLDDCDLSFVCHDFSSNVNQPSNIHYVKNLSENSGSLLGKEAFIESVTTNHEYSFISEAIPQEYCFSSIPLHSSKCFTSVRPIYCGSPGQAFRSSCSNTSIALGPADESRKFLRSVSGCFPEFHFCKPTKDLRCFGETMKITTSATQQSYQQHKTLQGLHNVARCKSGKIKKLK